jgi:nucleotide-binding universal stress UspA family protein
MTATVIANWSQTSMVRRTVAQRRRHSNRQRGVAAARRRPVRQLGVATATPDRSIPPGAACYSPPVPKRRSRPVAPLRRVLVATDFSAGAARAVARAARLPMGRGAALTILHVLPVGRTHDERTRLAAAARRALAVATRMARQRVRRSGQADIAIRPLLAAGHPVAEIVRSARRCGAELVVVGRHGERTFRDLLIGSTAERVIRRGDRPVLVVGRPARAPYRRPLVAIDVSASSPYGLQLARRVAGPGASLDVLHAHSVPLEGYMRRAGVSDEIMQAYRAEYQRRAAVALDKFLADALDGNAGGRRVLRRGDARRVILRELQHEPVDLVVVGTHARPGVSHLLLGSVAEAVVRGAGCDVLVARAPVAAAANRSQ